MERTATPVIDGRGGVSPMMAGIPLALDDVAIGQLERRVLLEQAMYNEKRKQEMAAIRAQAAQMSAQEQAYMRNQYEQGLQMAQMTRGMA